jgi:branched-chain amino acid transport system substrate-binding protein
MKMKSILIVAVVTLALLGAACSNSGTTTPSSSGGGGSSGTAASTGARDTFVKISGVAGVSDKEIDYAVIGTKSNNVLGTCILDCYAAGVEAYFQYQNEELGGVYGRQLKVGQTLDDELSSNQLRSLEVITDGTQFGVFDATLVASGFADLDDAGVPTYAWGINSVEMTGRQAVFGSLPVFCAECTVRSIPFLVGRSRATKVAALSYGVSANSKACGKSLQDSVTKYSSDIGGAEVVYYNDDLPFGLPNGIGPEVTAMKEAGVQFVAT